MNGFDLPQGKLHGADRAAPVAADDLTVAAIVERLIKGDATARIAIPSGMESAVIESCTASERPVLITMGTDYLKSNVSGDRQ
jgi:hypothetical protein